MQPWQEEQEAAILRIPNEFSLGRKSAGDKSSERFKHNIQSVLGNATPFSDWITKCNVCKNASSSKSNKTHHVCCDNRKHLSSQNEEPCKSKVETAVWNYVKRLMESSGLVAFEDSPSGSNLQNPSSVPSDGTQQSLFLIFRILQQTTQLVSL